MAIERGRLVRTKRFAPSGTVEETPERPPPDSPQAMVEEVLSALSVSDPARRAEPAKRTRRAGPVVDAEAAEAAGTEPGPTDEAVDTTAGHSAAAQPAVPVPAPPTTPDPGVVSGRSPGAPGGPVTGGPERPGPGAGEGTGAASALPVPAAAAEWRVSTAPLPQPAPRVPVPAPAPQVVVQRVIVPVPVAAKDAAPSTQGIWLVILVLAVIFVLAAVALEIVYLTPLVHHTNGGRSLGLLVGLFGP